MGEVRNVVNKEWEMIIAAGNHRLSLGDVFIVKQIPA